jgi:hypothetical protein
VDDLVPLIAQAAKCRIDPAGTLDPSIAQTARAMGLDQAAIEQRLQDFVAFKLEHGNVPYSANDKPSGRNLRRVIIRAFAEDNHWHCHLGLVQNGDPLVAYRVMAPNHIRLICITTHHENFVASKEFMRKYSAEFPKLKTRQSRLFRRK